MKKHILVVDDDPAVRESAARLLEDSGYQVTLAVDGDDGEARLKDTEVDLLILDLNMPNRDGWDVLETANAGRPLLPIILITGFVDQLATMSISGAGALLEKPIDVPLLLKTIEDLLAETNEERLRRVSDHPETEPWVRVNAPPHPRAFRSSAAGFDDGR